MSDPLKLMLQEDDALVETSSGEVMELDGHAIAVQVGRASSWCTGSAQGKAAGSVAQPRF